MHMPTRIDTAMDNAIGCLEALGSARRGEPSEQFFTRNGRDEKIVRRRVGGSFGPDCGLAVHHVNVRGASYYAMEGTVGDGKASGQRVTRLAGNSL